MYRRLCASPLGTIHVVEAGPVGGDPIVLLHQTPRSVDEFAELQPLLAAHHHVLAIDTPGYGCSDKPSTLPSIADYAAAVVAVLDGLGIARAHVLGHHTGGVIAVELAAGWPSRVASTLLSGPVYMDQAGRDFLRPFFVQWHPAPDGSHFTDKWQKFLKWTTHPDLVQRLVLDVFRAGETSEFGHLAVAEYRMEDRLPLASGPALLLCGSRDSFADRANLRRFEQAFSPTKVVEIDGGVFLPNEAPEAMSAAVLEFIASLG